MSNLDLPEGTKLFIKESLCPYYKGIWAICKKLWNRKQIHSFFTANDIIKFRFEEHGSVNVVTHLQDLKDLFSVIDFDVLYVSLLNGIMLGTFSLLTHQRDISSLFLKGEGSSRSDSNQAQVAGMKLIQHLLQWR